jgi:uncharacterized membrane protein HdeD (DUF308 family)
MSSGVKVNDPLTDTVDSIGKSWLLVLLLGVLTVGVGISSLNHPVSAYHTIAVLFGIWLLVSGVASIIRGLGSHMDGGARVLLVLSGALSLYLGSMFLHASILEKVALLSLYIGIVFLFRGIVDLFAGFAGKGQPGRGWTIFMGFVGMSAGLYMINHPFAGAATWITVVSWFLIILGIMELVGAFQIRSATKK